MDANVQSQGFKKGQSVSDNLDFIRAWFQELCSQLPVNIQYDASIAFNLNGVLDEGCCIHLHMFLKLVIKTPLQTINPDDQFKIEQVQAEIISGNPNICHDWHLEKLPTATERLHTNTFITWTRGIYLSDELEIARTNLLPRAQQIELAANLWKSVKYFESTEAIKRINELIRTIGKINRHVSSAKIDTYYTDLATFQSNMLAFLGLPPETIIWE